MSDETVPLGVQDAGTAKAEAHGPGTTFGRYVILRQVGSGGAGAVYAAFDPHLDRRVALKVLHTRIADTEDGEDPDAGRLLAEARTLARLTHPNVVAVHDVELHEGQAYVAMELVDGDDLATWVAAHAGDRDAIVRAYLAAGRGLEAAHARGIVHRDFKPRNVLVGTSAQTAGAIVVKVGDFGLARAPEVGGAITDDETAGVTADTDERRGLFGTPAYMAPEQHERQRVDAKSDQFAYCVSLFEGLTGTRPYTGTLFALAEAKRTGPPPWPQGDDTPRWLQPIVRRGLAPEPSARWPSMTELLTALAAGDPRRRRLRRLGVATGAVLLVATGVSVGGVGPDDARCSGGQGERDAVWSPARKDEIQTAMAAVPSSIAVDTASRVTAGLDDWADAWTQAHRATCEATARGEQSEALLDVRMACLRRQLGRLDALAGVLAEADPDVLSRAVSAVQDLPVPPGCREADARPDGVADPTEPPRAAEAAAIRSELDRAEAIASAGRYADALAVVDALVPRAEALAHPPVSAELAWQRGLALLDHGDLDEGFTSLEAAYADGLRLGHDEVAIGAAVSLAVGAANHRDDPTETLRWAKHARPLAERQGEDSPAVFRVRLAQAAALRLDGQLVAAKRQLRAVQADLTEALPPADPLHESAWIHLGHLYVAMGRFDDALAAYEEAKTRAIQIYGEGHPDVAKRIGDIGGVYSQLERFDQSVDTLREGLEQLQRALGPDHPDVAAMQLNLAAGLGTVDEIDEAEALLQASLATKTRVYGPDSVELYRPLVNLGTLRKQQRDPAGALVMLERALALQERAHHRTHPALVATLLNLASTHLWTGDHAAAAAAYDRMLAIAEANFEHPHRDFAQAYLGLANLRLGQERHAEALGYYEQATTEYEALGPSASGPLTMILTGRALTLEELGRKDEAGAIYLRAAQRGFEGSHMLAWERAMTRLRAGQWLRRHAPAGADDRTRAIALVEQGLVDAIEAGDHGTEFADEARRWLKRHRR